LISRRAFKSQQIQFRGYFLANWREALGSVESELGLGTSRIELRAEIQISPRAPFRGFGRLFVDHEGSNFGATNYGRTSKSRGSFFVA
jgi:hypothetical protein